MKKFSVSISYPPLESKKGIPFLSQNRQFQWTNTGNVIYPVIPAYAATALSQKGIKVYWDDAIAQKLSYQQWFNQIIKRKPNLIAIETKTPAVKKHWKIINQLKEASRQYKKWNLTLVLMGDHVTALPQESLNNSQVDYIITGGDYDFMLLNLVEHLQKKTKLEPGFYYKSAGTHKNSGLFALKHHHLDILPIIDRDLTQWHLYAYNNTNYKYKPGAYIMSARDCWWGKCTFCSWTTLYPHGTFRCFSVKHTLDEIENLVNNYGVKEIFDDAGTLPVGPWLKDLCQEIIKRGLNKKVTFGCNMRFAALNQEQYHLLKQAGFRFLLYGLESSNQKTLNSIQKNTQTKDARNSLKMAKNAGLEPHLTIMIGYPWETKKSALKTLNEARMLFRDGLADSMQATIIIPYPGTKLFEQCQKNNWLLTEDWDDYDMRQPVMKSPLTSMEIQQIIQGLFRGILTPSFLWRKIVAIRSVADVRFLSTYAFKYLQKLKDFPGIKTKWL